MSGNYLKMSKAGEDFGTKEEASEDILIISDSEEDDIESVDYDLMSTFPNEDVEEELSADIADKNELQITRFQDFNLKSELLRTLRENGLEYASEVQRKCISAALLGTDVLCEAKSNTGKTTVFILATLQQLDPDQNVMQALVLCKTCPLAIEIYDEYKKFTRHLPYVRVDVLADELHVIRNTFVLKRNCPHIVVGTSRRILMLLHSRALSLGHLRFLILDGYEKQLKYINERKRIQDICQYKPSNTRVMMFDSELSKDVRQICLGLLEKPLMVYIQETVDLTLTILQHFYINLKEYEKKAKLLQFVDPAKYSQIIFVNSVWKCGDLCSFFMEHNIPAIQVNRDMYKKLRKANILQFQTRQKKILITHGVQEIGMQRADVVFNYDAPDSAASYYYRVACAGRFGSKGIGITFITEENDIKMLGEVRNNYNIDFTKLPTDIDLNTEICLRKCLLGWKH